MLALKAMGKDVVLMQYPSNLTLLFLQTSGIPFPKTGPDTPAGAELSACGVSEGWVSGLSAILFPSR